MTPDSELLRRYVQDDSEAAFTELVRRHVDLVYSAAFRLVGGDRHSAQDVTQVVFVDLCRKARALARRESLAGWLHTAARYAAAKTVRAERRRGVREREASRMSTLVPDSEPEPDWDAIRPVLDEAIGRLNGRDREVILLRFFEGKDSKQIGLLFGLGENAANMRVRRALDRLRGILGRFGVTSTVSALATVLVAHGSRAAPLDMAERVAKVAISNAGMGSSGVSGLLARFRGFGRLRVALLTAAVGVPVLSSDYQPSPGVTLGQDGEAERRLREGTHLLGLSPSVTVRGVVLDGEGRSIPGAQVLVGYLGDTGSREGKSRIDGTFELRGCPPGRNPLTAEAPGFGAVTRDVECVTSGAPFRIVLSRGMPLRFVVTDDLGRPLPGATVRVGPARTTARGRQEPSPVQFSFEAVADVEGRVAWEDAPEGELQASASAAGYAVGEPVRLRPDGRDRVLTLRRALTLVGAVHDASTGRIVPRFRIVCGWPEVDGRDGRVSPRWSTLDRHAIGFCGGALRHEIAEAMVRADPNPGYLFRFEAEGYSPWVSRVVVDGETEVRFDVALHPAVGGTDDGPVREGRESGGARANAE